MIWFILLCVPILVESQLRDQASRPWKSNYSKSSYTFRDIGCDSYCLNMTVQRVFVNDFLKSWKFVIFAERYGLQFYYDGFESIFMVTITFPVDTIIDSNFDLILDFMHEQNAKVLVLEYLTGMDLDFFAPLRSIDNLASMKPYFLRLQSHFSLYHHKEYILTSDKCNSRTYEPLLTFGTKENVLGGLNELIFANSRNKICKYMFQNVSLYKLTFELYYYEYLETSRESSKLNSSINHVMFLNVDRLELNSKNLDAELFQNMSSLIFKNSILLYIQEDLFKESFKHLHQIVIQLFNTKNFLHGRGGVAWMKNLNYYITPMNSTNRTYAIDYIRKNMVSIEFRQCYTLFLFDQTAQDTVKLDKEFFPNRYYTLTDRDFCLLYDIPAERLVYIQLEGGVSFEIGLNTPCLVIWLYRYQDIYPDIDLKGIVQEDSVDYPNPSHDIQASGVAKKASTCNFTQLIQNCKISTLGGGGYYDDPYFILNKLGRSVDEAKIVILDYMQPIVCVISFITNMLVVSTIAYNHKRRHEIRSQPKGKSQEIILLDQPLYKYILFNSVLNSAYSLVNLIDYLTPCHGVRYNEHDYANRLSNNCVVRLIVFGVIGSVLKLMSNFSFLQISINRYQLVGKDHPEWVKKMGKISIKRFLICSLCLSSLLSSFNYFQANFFDLSPHQDQLKEAVDPHYDYIRDLILRTNGLTLLSTLTVIHDLFSYFLFCLFSLILDILTVKKLHDALVEKEKVKGKDERGRESERRSIVMVVVNSAVNFLLRAPELVSVIFYYIIISQGRYLVRLVCFLYSDCQVITDLPKSFCILSLCFCLLFYTKFNSVFRCSFLYLVRSVSIRLKLVKPEKP